MKSLKAGVMGRYRLWYSIIYCILIAYPFYKIILSAQSLDTIFQVIIYSSILLIPIGIYFFIPEIIILSYIVSGTVYQVLGTPGAPSLYEMLVYTLLIFHGDILTRLLTMGIGIRRIRARFFGIVFSIFLIFIVIGTYISISYGLAIIFIEFIDYASRSNIIAKMVIGYFLETRVGSIIVFTLVSLAVYYVLFNYVNGLLSDTVLLSKEYVFDRLKSYFNDIMDRFKKGKLWHQRLFIRSFLILIIFFTWALISPFIMALMSLLYWLMPHETLRHGFSFLLSLAISFIIYSIVRGKLTKLIQYTFTPKPIKFEGNVLKVSYVSLALSIGILISYIVVSMIFYPDKILHALYLLMGFDSPRYDPELYIYIDIFNKEFLSFSEQLPYLMDRYIDSVEMEFNWLIEVIKTIINVLWG